MLGGPTRMNCEVIAVKIPDNRTAAVLHVSGGVDLTTLDQLGGAIRRSLTVESLACLVVDLKEATHVDSSGIGMLLDAMRRANRRQVRFVLCGLNGAVHHVFERTRLNLLFEIRPTFGEAVLDLEAAAC